MDRIDRQRGGIHHDDRELRLVAGHEPGLEAGWGIGTGRVEGRGEGGGPDSTLRLREPGQPLPIEGVEKVAHVPAGGGLNRGLNRLVGCGGMVAGCWPGGSGRFCHRGACLGG